MKKLRCVVLVFFQLVNFVCLFVLCYLFEVFDQNWFVLCVYGSGGQCFSCVGDLCCLCEWQVIEDCVGKGGSKSVVCVGGVYYGVFGQYGVYQFGVFGGLDYVVYFVYFDGYVFYVCFGEVCQVCIEVVGVGQGEQFVLVEGEVVGVVYFSYQISVDFFYCVGVEVDKDRYGFFCFVGNFNCFLCVFVLWFFGQVVGVDDEGVGVFYVFFFQFGGVELLVGGFVVDYGVLFV